MGDMRDMHLLVSVLLSITDRHHGTCWLHFVDNARRLRGRALAGDRQGRLVDGDMGEPPLQGF